MLVYGECECFVMQMLYVCVLCESCGSIYWEIGLVPDDLTNRLIEEKFIKFFPRTSTYAK